MARRVVGDSFTVAIRAVEAIPGSLDRAVTDPAGRKAAERALGAIKTAQTDVAGTMAPLLGIVIGFGELDGD